MNKLYDTQFQLKMTSKQLTRLAAKCEKEAKSDIDKARHAIEKENIEGARIYSENSIRKKNEALVNLRLAARLDAVVSHLDTAIKMKTVAKGMNVTVKGMDKVLQSLDPVKISALMEKFEGQFETLEVSSNHMVNAIGSTVSSSIPQNEVDQLMGAIAAEHGLNIKQKLDVPVNQEMPAVENNVGTDDELEKKFAQLRAR